jgi:hypothetical protein
MSQCAGIKRAGGRCEVVVSGQQTYCYHHDPGQAEKRKRVATKGGKSKPNKELADIRRLIGGLIRGVLKGTTDRADAAVCGQLLNTQIRAVAVELKVREQLDLIERVEELESLLERQKERGGYGTQR